MTPRYPRDFRGHGPDAPDARWPGGAKIAISLVLNYEEGGENNILHDDAQSEAFLSDIAGAAPWPGQRHWNMESIYDYGARAGFWRLHRLFTQMDLPITIFGVTTALARNPEQVAAMIAAGWEVASHGLKWIDHRDMSPDEEARQIAESVRLHTEVVGTPPRGWYTGRCSINTVDLTATTGAFDWISDTYDDDLPYWREVGPRDQLVIPYTLEANDMRFATAPGYIDGEQFFTYLRDTFDTLYAEGNEGRAKMFSIGLHNRLIGRPGNSRASNAFSTMRGCTTASGSPSAARSRNTGPRRIRIPGLNAPARCNMTALWQPLAASLNTRHGLPNAHSDWNSAPPMTVRLACKTPLPACFAARPMTNGWGYCAPIPILQANLQQPCA